MTCTEAGRQGGRPSSLTPELTARICKLIEETACSVYTVAISLDVDWQTIYRWEQWGREGKQPYEAFCAAVMRARAKAEIELVRGVRNAAKKRNDTAVRANSWLLERRYPHDYGQRVKLEEQLGRLTDDEIATALSDARSRADRALGAGASEATDAAGEPGDGPPMAGADSVLPADPD